jgi:hypothetical protein
MRPGRLTLKAALPVAAALAIAAGLMAIALLPAATARALPPGFFGIVPQTPITPQDAARMRAGGVETIRVPISWAAVQPSRRSDFAWETYDAFFEIAARERLEVLPALGSLPRWISRDWRRLPIDSAAQRRGWTDFVRAAVERYGRGGEFWAEHGPGSAEPLPTLPVRAWQIWNEENFFYFTRPASPRRYARLLALSHPAIHRADRRAEVVIGGLFGDPRGAPPRAMDAVDFLDDLYRARRAKGSFDAVALHPYAADTAALRDLVEEVRRTMVRHGDRRAGLYITEMGWGSQNDPNVVSFEVGLRGQAGELRSAYRYLVGNQARLNLRQVDWFSWKDEPGSCAFCDSSGLFRRGPRFKPKPAWHAFVAATRGRF